jgi:hypothetical protein
MRGRNHSRGSRIQPGMLVLRLPEPPRLVGLQLRIQFHRPAGRLLRDPHLADAIRRRDFQLGLPERGRDLINRTALPLGDEPPPR